MKLSLSHPTSFTFYPLSSPSHWGGGGEVSERLHGPSCWLPGYTTTIFYQFCNLYIHWDVSCSTSI